MITPIPPLAHGSSPNPTAIWHALSLHAAKQSGNYGFLSRYSFFDIWPAGLGLTKSGQFVRMQWQGRCLTIEPIEMRIADALMREYAHSHFAPSVEKVREQVDRWQRLLGVTS